MANPNDLFPEYLADRISEKRRINDNTVMENIESDNNFNKKIESRADKTGLDRDFIIWKAKRDPTFAQSFSIDPLKQNIVEIEVLAYLKHHLGEKSVIKPPAGGDKSLIISNGAVIQRKYGGVSAAKSIDFIWTGTRSDGTTIKAYASHKYAKESGGSQTSQLNELERFLDQARNNTINNEFFFAIADGDYPEKTDWHRQATINYGKAGKAFACSTDELIYDLWQDILK